MIFWNYVWCVVPFSFDLAIYGSVLVCRMMSSQVHQDPNHESCWIRNVKLEEVVEKAKIYLESKQENTNCFIDFPGRAGSVSVSGESVSL